MILTVTKNGRWRLVGTPNEFADFINSTSMDPMDVMSMLASVMEGTSARFKDHRGWWELRGSRSDLAEILGFPEAKTVLETVSIFESQHPSVRVLTHLL